MTDFNLRFEPKRTQKMAKRHSELKLLLTEGIYRTHLKKGVQRYLHPFPVICHKFVTRFQDLITEKMRNFAAEQKHDLL